ncbi:MAG TPA: 1,4-alpha-glucan branching protein GlgB, partial [Zoogloea sp.]|nr:1,4-alpha-glucan branching protein GlgB [Zoogloea sp.]
MHLFNEGRNVQSYRLLGAHPDATGTVFRVWAPNAVAVAVVGDFNGWDGDADPMHCLGGGGVWEARVASARPGSLYRFEITCQNGGGRVRKSDPYARGFELRPGSAARVAGPSQHVWRDAVWMTRRAAWDWLHAPVNIYELHAGSWMRHPDGSPYRWPELAERLIPYALQQGYTHLELLPITEHPLDESWGYQTTGYFAPTSRYGSPDELRAFIDACHQAGLGVLLDWVPGHFPQDDWALARYDGTALYEHADPRLGVHADWGTHIFNYGRHEVRSFLLSSAHWWLAEFHFDGLRVDAVASMLYLDYSRRPGEWLPNRFGGRENLDAIDFLRDLNTLVHGEFPGALTLAEESTAWPQVSRPAYTGGLGFSMKWNMGWMNDSLRYFRRDPVHRRW